MMKRFLPKIHFQLNWNIGLETGQTSLFGRDISHCDTLCSLDIYSSEYVNGVMYNSVLWSFKTRSIYNAIQGREIHLQLLQ